MEKTTSIPAEYVLSTRVDLVDVSAAAHLVAGWAREDRGRMVCATNVHMVMEAHDDPQFAATVNGADLVVPDGRPIVWACRVLGSPDVTQVRGFDLMTHLCAVAELQHLKVGLYGCTPEVVKAAGERLSQLYPKLCVTYAHSPPFRPLTSEEDAADIDALCAAGVQVLFVSLGCPKQERWMAEHRDRLPCTAVGIGAALDMLAGRHGQAPRLLQRSGLEWVYRLSQEPRRLWARYAKHNSRFIVCFAVQYARRVRAERPRQRHVNGGRTRD